MKRAIQILCMAAVAGLVFAVAPTGAQEIYQWDAQSGSGSTVEDGEGTWEVGVGNWQNQTTPGNDVIWVDGNDAVFGGGGSGTAGKVLIGTVAPARLTFNEPFDGNYTLSRGMIRLDNGSVPVDDNPFIVTDSATGTTTVSSSLTLNNDTTVNTTNAASALTLSGGGGGAYRLHKDGPGTLTLSGPAAFSLGNGVNRNQGWRVNGGKLVIDGNVTFADGNNGQLTSTGASLDITGTFTSGGHDQLLRGTTTLSGTGRWNLRGDGVFAVANGENETATLNIRDSAVLDIDRTAGVSGVGNWSPGSLVLCMGWGPCTGTVNQDGGTVNVTSPVKPWGTNGGPGLVMGGFTSRPHEAKVETYNLNGGTLNASGVFNTNGLDPWAPGVLADPALGGHTAIFNFNGGLLKASQDDSTDPVVVSEGLNHLMGNLTHAYVKVGGAMIDTNGFNASINQALEHDPVLGGAPDGGLRKLGDGTLTLLRASTYTGGTTIRGGTLAISADGQLGSGGVTMDGGMIGIVGTALDDIGDISNTVAITSNGGGFDILDPAHTFLVDTVISGSGSLTKAGPGTLTLTRANTYGGATIIAGGTLGGTGSVAGAVAVASGGTLAPGASVGTFTVNNNLAMAPGGAIAIEVAPATHDQLVVTGMAALNGTLAVTALPDAATLDDVPLGTEFLVLTCATRDPDGAGPLPPTTFAASTGTLLSTQFALAPLYDFGGASGVTLKAAIPGDVELDLDVDFSDFTFFAANYNQAGKSWVDGDFNGNGAVNFWDFTYLAANYGIDVDSTSAGEAEAPSAGEVELHVDVITGEMWLVGNAATLSGYSITSTAGTLIPDGDGNATPFQFYLSNVANDIAAASVGQGVLVDGELALDATFDVTPPLSLPPDLIFSYGVYGQGGSLSGQVVVVPEPATLSLLALGGLAVLRRRRR